MIDMPDEIRNISTEKKLSKSVGTADGNVNVFSDEFVANDDFSEALRLLKAGHRVARIGWNGKGMWIQVQYPDAHSKMTLPYIYMKTTQGDLVPWLASQTDILSSDWATVDD